MAHKLAEHLQERFKGMHVDCEYNKNLEEEKEIPLDIEHFLKFKGGTKRAEELKKLFNLKDDGEIVIGDDLGPPEVIKVYPDIIIHKRGEKYPWNLAILEIKKSKNKSALQREFDEYKLKKYTKAGGLQYKVGAFIEFETEHTDTGPLYYGDWYKEGEKKGSIQ
jgi:hypothetical protein